MKAVRQVEVKTKQVSSVLRILQTAWVQCITCNTMDMNELLMLQEVVQAS